ncbi:MAG: NAD(P)-binding protein [Phyllobacteriaceae bacterium]|nr:NAD(P)-binding protein [Phyllobacteriaceae bacterium]
MSRHSLIIAGGGIGGLTAALALARDGHRVTVLEQAAELAEVGAGIQISPNASRVLIGLGLREALERVAVTPTDIRIFSVRAGGEVARTPLGDLPLDRYGAPFWVIHRADLLGALAVAARTDPRIELVLDARVRDVAAEPGGIHVQATVAGRSRVFVADGLIGADGVRSRVRVRVRGGPPARYTGRTAYRATLPIEAVPEEVRRSTCLWFSTRAHVVHYPIRAGREWNVVAIAEDAWHDESWSVPADRAEVARVFGLDKARWPDLARELLSLPDHWTKWALCGFDCDFDWSSGAVTLLGDAAHATLPFAAQGGGMAIEDAEVLARTLIGAPNLPAAFLAYESLRKPRTRAVVEQAVKNGRIYHMPDGLAFFRDLTLRLGAGSHLTDRLDWIYRWKAV